MNKNVCLNLSFQAMEQCCVDAQRTAQQLVDTLRATEGQSSLLRFQAFNAVLLKLSEHTQRCHDKIQRYQSKMNVAEDGNVSVQRH